MAAEQRYATQQYGGRHRCFDARCIKNCFLHLVDLVFDLLLAPAEIEWQQQRNVERAYRKFQFIRRSKCA